MKTLILFVCLFCSSTFVGCGFQSASATGDSTSISQESEYRESSMVTLSFGKDVKIEATIKILNESIGAISGKKPRAKLLIRNLNTGRVIHEEECGNSTLSNPGFWIDKGSALVMTTRGGSGDAIAVYEVTESDARIVLLESYRSVTIAMPNDDLGGQVGFLVVDAEHASDPLVIRRYEYSPEQKRFVLTGKANFAQFMKTVRQQFANPSG